MEILRNVSIEDALLGSLGNVVYLCEGDQKVKCLCLRDDG